MTTKKKKELTAGETALIGVGGSVLASVFVAILFDIFTKLTTFQLFFVYLISFFICALIFILITVIFDL